MKRIVLSQKVQELCDFAKENKFEKIKDSLFTEKITVFLSFLCELYRGIGYSIRQEGEYLLLSVAKKPEKVILLIRGKFSEEKLGTDEVVEELIAFERKSEKYDCHQFKLYNYGGFETSAYEAQEFNLLLADWENVKELISCYDKPYQTPPYIELFAHNALAYEEVMAMWEKDNRVAVVQPTGTGKSYLIAKIMIELAKKRTLSTSENAMTVISPSHHILRQQHELARWTDGVTKYLTYAKLCRMQQEIQKMNPEFINLDEFHRCGAREWSKGVSRLLESHPNAKVLGTSATPIRYLDGERDMSDELFDNNVAVDLSLSVAIVKRILPTPRIVTALYTLEEEVRNLKELMRDCKISEEDKQDIEAKINEFEERWGKDFSIPGILREQLAKTNTRKIIVFCSGEEHLGAMQKTVTNWFAKAFDRKIKTYKVSSKMTDEHNNETLDKFRQANGSDNFHLLFAINMLNEGIHVSDVGAVILLRSTDSPIIFYQQIGRCIDVNAENAPVIFDFVGNFQSICTGDFCYEIKEAKKKNNQKRIRLGLPESEVDLQVIDKTAEVVKFFDEIAERLRPWNVWLETLKAYVEEHGDAIVRKYHTTSSGLRLGLWTGTQREYKKRGKLSEKKINLLENQPGWSWDPFEDVWQKNFEALKEFLGKYGHTRVSRDHITSSGLRLGVWVATQRRNKDKLLEERIRLLEGLSGWSWDPFEDAWQKNFEALKEFFREYGHVQVPRGYIASSGLKLGVWVARQRQNKNKLTKEKINLLESMLGWSWDLREDAWQKNFEALKKFLEEYGYVQVPKGYITSSGLKLEAWVETQRVAKKQNKLSEARIKLLESMPGWSWDLFEDAWQKNFEALKKFLGEYGHVQVPISYTTSSGLRLGVWVANQRRKKDKLSQKRIKLLEGLSGWSWDSHEDAWQKNFEALKKFLGEYGHVQVPISHTTLSGLNLGTWVKAQCVAKKQNKLAEARVKLLEKLDLFKK